MPTRRPEDRLAARSPYARHDNPAVQPGDLIFGVYDGCGRTQLRRSFCGPIAAVSPVKDRRESGEFVTITLVDGREMTTRTHTWFAVHPAGTWEQQRQTAAPKSDTVPEVVEPAPDCTVDGEIEPITDDDSRAVLVKQPTESAEVPDRDAHVEPPAADEEPDPWGPVLAEIASTAGRR